ncbi:uncharacterized protein DUF4255 [Rarobacter faecitabidus]|uniref:Uncharacterized protein DUF4255 n=1 Tax=Rarobacter faecitabidus TaxID=13243 RepID=A0A542ZE87_RARFA|nr:uncharacterized protein DUF4255 [Rarobacter faecitabidus]
MLIPAVDSGLESLLRATLPLTPQQGDVSFDAPSSSWAAQVNRLTVNLFLYDVCRSAQPLRTTPPRVLPDGTEQTRYPLPMVQLTYLVSAWAGTERDAHALLGDVLLASLAHQILPPEHLPIPLSSNVQLAVATDSQNKPREVWSALSGPLRASFTLLATVAGDAYDWREEAERVEGVSAAVLPSWRDGASQQ